MTTKYRIVKLVNDPRTFRSSDLVYVYSIQKKTWFGWKQVDWHFSEQVAKNNLHNNFLALKKNPKVSGKVIEVIEEVEV